MLKKGPVVDMTDIFRWFHSKQYGVSRSVGARPESAIFKRFLSESHDDDIAALQQLKDKQRECVTSLNVQNDTFLKADALRSRLSVITRRNKSRTILVIPDAKVENEFVTLLLRKNSNAQATFAKSVKEGLYMLQSGSFDMVYLVMDMSGEVDGPCFFSMDNPKDAELRAEAPYAEGPVSVIRKYSGSAEIVVVCGASNGKCPIAEHIFNGRYEKEAV